MIDEISNIPTRERVLQTLLRKQRCTIHDLANEVGINPISVRHHIARLEADGMVASAEERHGVGRPRRHYFLTERGQERFPTHYMRLTLRLLEQLKEHMPGNLVNELFSKMAEDMAEDYAHSADLVGLPLEKRLTLMKQLLNSEGFNLDWERIGDQYHIREISCPYLHIGQNHPEVCRVDQTLISAMLAVPAEKVKCILNGDSCCTYVVSDAIPNLIAVENNS
jgi:DeoR family suf operon transcriptional repressor